MPTDKLRGTPLEAGWSDVQPPVGRSPGFLDRLSGLDYYYRTGSEPKTKKLKNPGFFSFCVTYLSPQPDLEREIPWNQSKPYCSCCEFKSDIPHAVGLSRGSKVEVHQLPDPNHLKGTSHPSHLVCFVYPVLLQER